MEIWKYVPGFETHYEVSNRGRVRSSKNKTTHSTLHGERIWKQRIMRLKTDKKGYKRVCLWKDKTPHGFLVHRLVALAFISKTDGKEYINHIDGNPSNNLAENLEWCDHRENLMHAYEMRLNKAAQSIVLYNTNTKEAKFFISKAEASRFLDRYPGFISSLLIKGIKEVDEYLIFQH